jgi:hypothetical protein
MRFELSLLSIVLASACLPYGQLHGKETPSVKRFCAHEWPVDFEMQEYCQKTQFKAVAETDEIIKGMGSNVTLGHVFGTCFSDWRKPFGVDWTMVVYCYQNQKRAYNRLTR